ncbi:MAG: sulfite exporter TauE/SafE family protein [Thermoleophilia bacterium]
MATFTLILVVAALAGVLGSMLGIGGGLLIVPFLTLALGVPMKVAIGASLIGVIATSSAAQVVYVTRGLSHTRLGITLEMATTLGALAGGITAVLMNARVLQTLFALMLLYATWSMSRRPAGAAAPAPTGRLDTVYNAPGVSPVTYGVRRLPLGMVASFFAGNVSGLLGVGGGVIKVPVMTQVMGVPMKAAFATSNFMLGVTAATSAALYFGRGFVEPYTAVPVALGVLVGAQVGPRLATRMQARSLRILFQVLLVVFAVQMVGKALAL